MDNQGPNKDYVIQSLQQQLANSTLALAEREAIINQLYEKINELEDSKGANNS